MVLHTTLIKVVVGWLVYNPFTSKVEYKLMPNHFLTFLILILDFIN